jgi:hypothetical protein
MAGLRHISWVLCARVAILSTASCVPACVVGAEVRPPREHVARGAWIPRDKTAATDLAARDRVVVRGPSGGTQGGTPPRADMEWMAPYAHWSGAEYQLVPGSFQERAPAYTWRRP